MPRIHKKNNFTWLTIALIGLLLTGALSRDVPANLTLQVIEYSSIALLLLSLLSLKRNIAWVRWLAIIVGLLLAIVVLGSVTEHDLIKYAYLGLLLTFMRFVRGFERIIVNKDGLFRFKKNDSVTDIEQKVR